MKIPSQINSTVCAIDAAHQSAQEQPRPHMGCSVIGHHCERYIWLSFRWAVIEKFDGRMLRLFRRGHREESVIVSDLKNIGVKVTFSGIQQKRVEFDAHVSGSLDGIAEYGVPESPNKKHILEFKTHSLKSFDALIKEGVQKSKPQHYAQMQLYMLGTGIDRALYIAVCKNDDRLYTERVKFNKQEAEAFLAKGQRLALSDRIPPPISTDSTWYKCKFCSCHDFCHGTGYTREVNCRTCAHSTATKDSTWICERHGSNEIPEKFQYQACDSHVIHPDMVPWPVKGSESNKYNAVYVIEGKNIENGEPCANVYSSREILSNPHIVASGRDEFIDAVREELEAEIR